MTWSLTPADISRYHMEAQIQSPIITKNEGHPEENRDFKGENISDISVENKNTSGPHETTPWNTRHLKTTIEYDHCEQ